MTEPTRRSAGAERDKPAVPPMRDEPAVPVMPGGAVPGGGGVIEPTAPEPEVARPGTGQPVEPDSRKPAAAEPRGAEPGVAPPSASPLHLKRTRISGLWIGITVAAVVLLLLLVFIVQNNTNVTIYFFGWGGAFPLGVALLLAAICGVLLVAVPGYGRIIQLRRAARRASRRQ
jgi:uncharacterized integral membrane protein